MAKQRRAARKKQFILKEKLANPKSVRFRNASFTVRYEWIERRGLRIKMATLRIRNGYLHIGGRKGRKDIKGRKGKRRKQQGGLGFSSTYRRNWCSSCSNKFVKCYSR